MRISERHWRRLSELFCGSPCDLVPAAFVMLLRYSTVMEGDPGWHAAVPGSIFRAIRGHWGEYAECFANPLNTSSAVFCSAFPDVDSRFGSRGSFFDNAFNSGIFCANPPFDHAVSLATAHHVVNELARCADNTVLTFIVFLPGSDGGVPLQSLSAFKEVLLDVRHRFVCNHETIAGVDSPFLDGAQHVYIEEKRFTPRLDTVVFVAQSPAAERKFPSVEGLRSIKAAWVALGDAGDVGQKRRRT